MKILGISIGHDSSACLVEDGKIVRYVAEERFNRIKVGLNNAHESIKYCLGEYKMEDMDRVVISSGLHGKVKYHFDCLLQKRKMVGVSSVFRGKTWHVNNVGIVDHHLCHAAASYFTSGLDNSLIVSIDGIGEDTTHFVAVGKGKEITPIHIVKPGKEFVRGKDGVFKECDIESGEVASLGWFYGAITEALGWRMICDEGKTMGLAPYGDPNVIPEDDMRKMLYAPGPIGFYDNDGKVYYRTQSADYYETLADKYGRENLAAAGQQLLEKEVIAYIKKWLDATGQKNLCVSGGVFLNVKLNQKIRETFKLDNFWPFPLSGDSGLSVGAALSEYWKKTDKPFFTNRLKHLYYGPEYSNEEIESVLLRNKLRYRPYNVLEIAGLLAKNKIVGWFQGRMEGGPRSLGGRSILMSPINAKNKDIINRDVKFRESFRPFCPSVREGSEDQYFDGSGEFMIEACNVKTDDIPGVTHVDKTARPQVVWQVVNPKFHELLTRFGEITGHPVLLNTSLNVMGQPIICNPDDAIRCFYGVGIDVLVLGDFVLEKEPL